MMTGQVEAILFHLARYVSYNHTLQQFLHM